MLLRHEYPPCETSSKRALEPKKTPKERIVSTFPTIFQLLWLFSRWKSQLSILALQKYPSPFRTSDNAVLNRFDMMTTLMSHSLVEPSRAKFLPPTKIHRNLHPQNLWNQKIPRWTRRSNSKPPDFLMVPWLVFRGCKLPGFQPMNKKAPLMFNQSGQVGPFTTLRIS